MKGNRLGPHYFCFPVQELEIARRAATYGMDAIELRPLVVAVSIEERTVFVPALHALLSAIGALHGLEALASISLLSRQGMTDKARNLQLRRGRRACWHPRGRRQS